MGFCEFDGVGLLPYKGAAILDFNTFKFDLLGLSIMERESIKKETSQDGVKQGSSTEQLPKKRGGRKQKAQKETTLKQFIKSSPTGAESKKINSFTNLGIIEKSSSQQSLPVTGTPVKKVRNISLRTLQINSPSDEPPLTWIPFKTPYSVKKDDMVIIEPLQEKAKKPTTTKNTVKALNREINRRIKEMNKKMDERRKAEKQ